MVDIIKNLKISVHNPCSMIINFRDIVDELYFIYKGSVTMFDKKLDIDLVILPAESYFGDI